MPIIKPVSELRNYPDVLKEVKAGVPVYLTKNGSGRYVLMDIADYANVEAAERLNYELMRGRLAGETQGWISKDAMRQHFGGEHSLEPDPRLVGVSIADADLFDDCSTMFEVMGEK